MKTKFNIAAQERQRLITTTNKIARRAGNVLLCFYGAAAQDDGILQTEIKADNSPVTAADKAAHNYITAALQKLTPGLAIISEENKHQPPLIPGQPYWVVDPLDGTKEFLHRTGAFAVKIALIDNDKPVLGSVYSPAHDVLYYSTWNGAAFREDDQGLRRLQTRPAPDLKAAAAPNLRTLFNTKHAKKECYRAAQAKMAPRGLALPAQPDGIAGLPRNLQVAEGLADLYVDCGANITLEQGCGFAWDYAPDWLILRNAGGIMIEINSGQEPDFKEPCRNRNAYIAFGDKRLGKSLFP